jgi:hypothetical protein
LVCVCAPLALAAVVSVNAGATITLSALGANGNSKWSASSDNVSIEPSGRSCAVTGVAETTEPVLVRCTTPIGGGYDSVSEWNVTVLAPIPPRGILGTNPRYTHWYDYLLFFLCFGFIWMWS